MIKNFKIEMNTTDYTFHIVVDSLSDYHAFSQLINKLLADGESASKDIGSNEPKYSLTICDAIYNAPEKYVDIVCPRCGEAYILCPAEMEEETTINCYCGEVISCHKETII